MSVCLSRVGRVLSGEAICFSFHFCHQIFNITGIPGSKESPKFWLMSFRDWLNGKGNKLEIIDTTAATLLITGLESVIFANIDHNIKLANRRAAPLAAIYCSFLWCLQVACHVS